MKNSLHVFALSLMVWVTACETPADLEADKAARVLSIIGQSEQELKEFIESENLAPNIWTAEGNLAVSPVTGLICPDRLGDYARISVSAFTDVGDNVSCSYGKSTGKSVVSLFVYNNADDTDEEIDAIMNLMLTGYNAKKVNTITAGQQAPAGFKTRLAWFKSKGQITFTQVFLGNRSVWRIKLRATYGYKEKDAIGQDVETLLETAISGLRVPSI